VSAASAGAAAVGGAALVVPRLVDARLALLTEACAVLAVVLLLTALMVSLGQQREAGLLLGVAVVWDEALRPLLAPMELPLLETRTCSSRRARSSRRWRSSAALRVPVRPPLVAQLIRGGLISVGELSASTFSTWCCGIGRAGRTCG
jgi:hypothetical protein